MKKIVIVLLWTAISAYSQNKEEQIVHSLMDQWHVDVAQSNFQGYFDFMDEGSFFIGTDANERWTKAQFMAFSKPFFDRKSTWDFKVIDRNLIVDRDYPIAWFDEVLDTWMGLCRGSGVLKKIDGEWKLEHYVLSLTVPNDFMDAVIEIMPSKDLQKDSYSPSTKGN